MIVEQWLDLPVENLEKLYSISDFGRVKSLAKKYQGKFREDLIMKQQTDRGGYSYIMLNYPSTRLKKFCLIHRLVALAFIPNPENKKEVNHIDGNKLNNHISNLEWVTSSENSKHALATGLDKPKRGELNGKAILTTEQVMYIKKCFIDKSKTVKELSLLFNVAKSTIENIKYNHSWNHIKIE